MTLSTHLTAGSYGWLRLVTVRQTVTASDIGRIENVSLREDFISRILQYHYCQNHVLGDTGTLSTQCHSLIPAVVQALIRNQYLCRSKLLSAGTTLPQGSADGRSPPCQPPPCPQAGLQLRTPTLVRSTTSTPPQVRMHLPCLGHAFVPLMSSQKLKRESACPYFCHHVCLSDYLPTCLCVMQCVCMCLSLSVLQTATNCQHSIKAQLQP